MSTITWVNPRIIPRVAHLLHHVDVWCVVNRKGEVAVYKMGTTSNDANSLQGNTNRNIAAQFVPRYEQAIGVAFFEHIFLPDSPGRY